LSPSIHLSVVKPDKHSERIDLNHISSEDNQFNKMFESSSVSRFIDQSQIKTEVSKSQLESSHKPEILEPIDKFIDYVVEGKESSVKELTTPTSISSALQQELEYRQLPPEELISFDGNPSQWPEFIENFKTRIHLKRTFNDSIHMQRLLSVLKGNAKRSVSSIGTNGIFYAAALKSLKHDFGNPFVVSHMKLKSLFEKPQINNNDRTSIRQFHQELKCVNTSKHQIILPTYHQVTQLIIKHIHESNHHCGRDQTLSFVRLNYWIIPTTMDNTNHQPPFTHTGIHYFGPILIKKRRKTRSTQAEIKRYGDLFTCLTTRAVHLEVAGDMSTDSFLLTLRRFIARRGKPQTIYSDNCTNFVGAEVELRKALNLLNQSNLNNYLLERNIKWKFNPPSSPWMGGASESIVKLAKRPLKTVTNERAIYDENLVTFFTEVEATLNSRPLVSISDDVNDFNVITPNSFILGTSTSIFRTSDSKDAELSCRQRWKAVEALTNVFWRRYVSMCQLYSVVESGTKSDETFKSMTSLLFNQTTSPDRLGHLHE